MRVNHIGYLQNYSTPQNKKQDVSFTQEPSNGVALLKTLRDFAAIGFIAVPFCKGFSKNLDFVPNYAVAIIMGICLAAGLICHFRSRAIEN